MRSALLFSYVFTAAAEPKVEFGPGYAIPMSCTVEGTPKQLSPTLQVAVSHPEQSLGLMYRKSLDQDTGMIFPWTEGAKRVLYMRNTYVPLDAGWFDGAGHLMQVSPLQPLDETWVWSTSDQIHFAVEMNLGWYKANCDQGSLDMDMEAVRAALTAKQADPDKYLQPANVTSNLFAQGLAQVRKTQSSVVFP
jgi:uncharacterized membrane protein (UPF0127 family)